MSGPGKIGQALHLNLTNNHIDLTKKGELYVTEGVDVSANDIIATPRIGISKAQEKLWRFIITKELHDQIKESI